MSRDASFLFAGIKFNRKTFAKDFERFKEKKESEDLQDSSALTELKKYEPNEEKSSSKKRKRKAAANVQGFDVFNNSSLLDKAEHNNEVEDELAMRKKEVHRQIMHDAIMRKNHSIHVTGSNIPSPLEKFEDLRTRYKCKKYLLKNFVEHGYKEPTPIQRQAIPVLLSGRDCFACAPTGSGKTLAFICPMLMKLKKGLKDGVRAVILCPTRELASQTTRECKKLAKGKKFYIKLMTKGLLRKADFSKMPCDILISTPLRLTFAIRKRKLDLSRVEYLVLDEADKLFEGGFVKQIGRVVQACSNPQIIRSLFSATLPDTVEELARTTIHDAVRIIVGSTNSASEFIKQKLVFAGSEQGKLLALRQSFAEV